MRKIKFLCWLFIGISYQLSFSQNFSVCNYLETAKQVQSRLIQYFEKFPHQEHKSYNQRLLLVYIVQKFHLPLKLPKNYLHLEKIDDEDTLYKKYFERLINPHFKPSLKALHKDYATVLKIDHLLLWSLYSDKLPWDKECESTLNYETGFDSYSIRWIAHVALPYYWAKSLNKNLRKEISDAFEQHFEQWQKHVSKGLEHIPGYTDTGMEGLLAFVFMNQMNEIPQKSMEEFLFYTRPDGGYPWDTEKNISNFHASLIALWLVSEVIEFCH